MQDNSEQAEFWNGEVGAKWAQQQQLLDATLKPISKLLLEKAAGQAGERALDIGCGCGDTSLALGQSGLAVTGVDISAPMLEHARNRITTENVQFLQADAASENLAQRYDLLLSRFGVMFFSTPKEAFINLKKHAKPGARLSFVCWQPPQLNAWVSVPMMAAKDMLPETPQADPYAPGPFAFADATRTTDILASAGWQNIETDDIRWDMRMGDSVNEAMNFVTQIGPLSGALRELPESAHEQVLEKVQAAMQAHQSPTGVTLTAASWLVSARA